LQLIYRMDCIDCLSLRRCWKWGDRWRKYSWKWRTKRLARYAGRFGAAHVPKVPQIHTIELTNWISVLLPVGAQNPIQWAYSLRHAATKLCDCVIQSLRALNRDTLIC